MLQKFSLLLILSVFPVYGEADCKNNFFEKNRVDVFKLNARTSTGIRDGTSDGRHSLFEIAPTVTLKNWDACTFQMKIEIKDAYEEIKGSFLYELDEQPLETFFHTENLLFTMENGLVKDIFPSEKIQKDWNHEILNLVKSFAGLFQIQEGKRNGMTALYEDDVTGRCEVIYNEEKNSQGIIVISKSRNLNNCSHMSSFSESNINTKSESLLFNSSSHCLYTMKEGNTIATIKCKETRYLVPLSTSDVHDGYVTTLINLTHVSSTVNSENKPSTLAKSKRSIFYDYKRSKIARDNQYQRIFRAKKSLRNLKDAEKRHGKFKYSSQMFEQSKESLRHLGSPAIDEVHDSLSTNDEKRIFRDSLISCGTAPCIRKYLKLIGNKGSAHRLSSLAFNADPFDGGITRLLQNFYRISKDPTTILAFTTLYARAVKYVTYSEKVKHIVSRNADRALSRYFRSRKRKCSRKLSKYYQKEKEVILKAVRNINFVFANSMSRLGNYVLECMEKSPHPKIVLAAVESYEGSKLSPTIKRKLIKIFESSQRQTELRIASFRVLILQPGDVEDFIKIAINIANKLSEDPQIRLFISSYLKTHARVNPIFSTVLKKYPLKKIQHPQTKESYFKMSQLKSSWTNGTIKEWAIYEDNVLRSSSYAIQVEIFGATIDLFEIERRIENSKSGESNIGTAYIKMFGKTIDMFTSNEIKNIGADLIGYDIQTMINAIFGGKAKKEVARRLMIFEGKYVVPTILGCSVILNANISAEIAIDVIGKLEYPSIFSKISNSMGQYKFNGYIFPRMSMSAGAVLSVRAPNLTEVGTRLDVNLYATKKIEGTIKYKSTEDINIEYKLDKDNDVIFNISSNITSFSKKNTVQMKQLKDVEKTCSNEVWGSSRLLGINMCYESRLKSPTDDFKQNLLAAPLSLGIRCSLEDPKLNSYVIWFGLNGDDKIVTFNPVGTSIPRSHVLDVTINDSPENNKTSLHYKTSHAEPNSIIEIFYGTEANQVANSYGDRFFEYGNFRYNSSWIMTSSQKCFKFHSSAVYSNGNILLYDVIYKPSIMKFNFHESKTNQTVFLENKSLVGENHVIGHNECKDGTNTFFDNILRMVQWLMHQGTQ